MIKIHPKIDYQIKCPECQTILKNEEFIVNGTRNLVKTTCEFCLRSFVCDLPSGQAIYTPLIMDIRSYEIYGKEKLDWMVDPLKDGYGNKTEVTVKIEKINFRESQILVLINCLDYLYGHSLLKLLNTQRYLRKGNNLWIIVPRSLSHLVPEGISQLWIVELPITSMKNWFTDINRQVRREISKHKEVFLAKILPQPSYTSFDINNFVRLPKKRKILKGPVVVFVYREDRCWGGNPYIQWVNIVRLYKSLKSEYPDLKFVLTGLGKTLIFPSGIFDLRRRILSQGAEKNWLAVWAQANCVIGVHGSNMLLPSALSFSAIELLPKSRLGNILQDYIPPRPAADIIESLYRFRILHGNNRLSDIKPKMVAEITSHLINYRGKFFYQMYPGEID